MKNCVQIKNIQGGTTYQIWRNGIIVDEVTFSTFNKGNRADELVGNVIEKLLKKHKMDLSLADPMSYTEEEEEL